MFEIYRAILTEAWAIRPQDALGYYKLLVEKQEVYAEGYDEDMSIVEVQEDGTLYVKHHGVITQQRQVCGPMGTQQILTACKAAIAQSEVLGLILDLDTPGGQVRGTQELADFFVQLDVPKVAVVGMCCSAGMWLASSMDKIFAAEATAEIGSIGTMASWQDFTKWREEQGITLHEVYAKTSPDKNIEFREAEKGNYEPMQDHLTRLNAIFQAHIREQRTGVKEAALTGKTYLAEEAKAMGLIDGLGGLDAAQAYLAGKKPKETTTSNPFDMNKYQAIGARLLGIDPEAAANDDNAKAEIEAVKAQLEQLQQEEVALQAEIKTAKKDAVHWKSEFEAQKKIAEELQTKLEGVQKKYESLASKPAPKVDVIPKEEQPESPWSAIGGEKHEAAMKEAENYL